MKSSLLRSTFLTLSTAFLVASSGLATIAQAHHVRWATYRSDLLNARMTVPAAWMAKKTNNALAFHTPGSMEVRAGVGLMRSGSSMTIEQAAEAQIAREGETGWVKSYARVSGMRAMKVVGSPKNNPDLRMVQYYIETASGPYLLQLMAPTRAWALYKPLFARIVTSIQIS